MTQVNAVQQSTDENPEPINETEILTSALEGLEAAREQLVTLVDASTSSEKIIELGESIKEVEDGIEELKQAIDA